MTEASQAGGERADPKFWCDTCEGSGSVHQEHQAGCHVGGDYPCPDCDGKGYWTRAALSAPPADPLVMFPNVDGKDNDVLYPERTPVAAVAQPVAGRLLKAFGARTAFEVGDRALPLMLGPNWNHQFCSGEHNEWLCIRFNSTEERDEFRAAAKDWENVTRDEMEAPGTACTACGDSGVVTDTEGRNWPCYRHCAALAASPSSERQDVGGGK